MGSITEVISAAGNILQKYDYRSFGKIISIKDDSGADISSNPVLRTSFTYTGREFEEDTGLFYYRARYLSAATGRFLQADPDPGNVDMPLTAFNKYIYASNNPLIFVDPSGMFIDLIVAAIGALLEGIGALIGTVGTVFETLGGFISLGLGPIGDVIALSGQFISQVGAWIGQFGRWLGGGSSTRFLQSDSGPALPGGSNSIPFPEKTWWQKIKPGLIATVKIVGGLAIAVGAAALAPGIAVGLGGGSLAYLAAGGFAFAGAYIGLPIAYSGLVSLF